MGELPPVFVSVFDNRGELSGLGRGTFLARTPAEYAVIQVVG